jgi:molybdate/tungstate transport system ATP-binding protein
MIEVSDLYRDWKEFSLKDINIEIKENEYFVILGPTGAGKTLLLEIIAGFYFPDRGEVRIAGQEVTNLPPEKRRIGFIYQDYSCV